MAYILTNRALPKQEKVGCL